MLKIGNNLVAEGFAAGLFLFLLNNNI